MKQDALGNEIVMGKLYGYANNRNGINNVIIGRPVKKTKQGVTLDIVKHRSGAYDGLTDGSPKDKCERVSVKSVMLFPINEFPKYLEWRKVARPLGLSQSQSVDAHEWFRNQLGA